MIRFVDLNHNGHWDSGEPVVFDSNGSQSFDAGEPILYNPGSVTIAPGTPTSADNHIKFVDANANGIYDSGETVIYDANGNSVFDTGDTVLAGTTPATNTPLKGPQSVIYASGPCVHFQQGIGANTALDALGHAGTISSSQVTIANRFYALNWIAPFDWATNPPIGIAPFPPVLYEGTTTLSPASVVGCPSGYDC
jgi:hypothetical protein